MQWHGRAVGLINNFKDLLDAVSGKGGATWLEPYICLCTFTVQDQDLFHASCKSPHPARPRAEYQVLICRDEAPQRVAGTSPAGSYAVTRFVVRRAKYGLLYTGLS